MDTPPPVPPATAQARRGWFARNWKWFVPTGCLTHVALACIFFAAIFVFVFGMMKSTDVYKTALERAKSDARVTAALGTPISEGFLVSGSTHVDGASGDANLSIPISGPKGKGTVYVVAKKSAGEWTYEKLIVEIEQTKERINLPPPSE